MEEEVERVFISHSQKDFGGKKFISLFCSAINVLPKFVEYEKMSNEEAVDINNKILGSKYLFVLLSDHVVSSEFTINWIAFEMGIAFSNDIPIIVFENYNKSVKFPVPYVDYYIHYYNTSKEIEYLKESFNCIDSANDTEYFYLMECSHCNKSWSMLNNVEDFHCPYCLGELESKED